MTQNATQADYGQENLEAMAARLVASGAYRVARRLDLAQHLHADMGEPVRLGLVLDVETTGLNPRTDEIVELAMAPFHYTEAGHITAVLPAFSRLRQPTRPIPAAITRLTGISDAMVEGCNIDPDDVAAFVAQVDLVIAHNAKFDRPFAEAFCPILASLPWACSYAQVDWSGAGHAGSRLVNLLFDASLFVTAHRALDDCQAVLALLARELPGTGKPAMAALLATARQPTVRISAAGASYAAKDWLKSRGYSGITARMGGPAPGSSTSPRTRGRRKSPFCARRSSDRTTSRANRSSPHTTASPTAREPTQRQSSCRSGPALSGEASSRSRSESGTSEVAERSPPETKASRQAWR